MRLLEFMFIDIWHFAGCFVILLVIASLFARRPNVTNLYEVPKEYWDEKYKADSEEKPADDAKAQAEASKKMWERDV